MQLIADKYKVINQIGRGGMGVVYKVYHRTLETTLALKALPAEFAADAEIVRRFHQEARVMAQLQHPNIVRVLDVDRDGDTHYFIMECIEGYSLGQYLREQGPLSVSEGLEIGLQVARALEYAHRHTPPVIHRDIKPDNILIEAHSGRAVVTDFGIAKVVGAAAQTQAGLLLGTLLYCAPEQILQEQGLDGRADLYSLGLVMYEMVANRPFFADLDERTLLGRVLYGPGENVPIFPALLAPEFVSLVTQAIAREPEHRYQQAADLLHDIEACLALHAQSTPTKHLADEIFVHGETSQTVRPSQTGYTPGRRLLQGWVDKLSRPQWIGRAVSVLLLTLISTLMGLRLLSAQFVDSPQPAGLGSPSVPERSSSQNSQDSPSSQTSQKIEDVVWTLALPASRSKAGSVPETSSSQPAEQPVFPLRRYRVTTATAVRTAPAWRGKEIAWLKPGMSIQAFALNENWLKVVSRSNPPKPAGYVWQDDVRLP